MRALQVVKGFSKDFLHQQCSQDVYPTTLKNFNHLFFFVHCSLVFRLQTHYHSTAVLCQTHLMFLARYIAIILIQLLNNSFLHAYALLTIADTWQNYTTEKDKYLHITITVSSENVFWEAAVSSHKDVVSFLLDVLIIFTIVPPFFLSFKIPWYW